MKSTLSNETLTLHFMDEPTANGLNTLLQKTYDVLDSRGVYREVVVDMGRVNYIDSTGITFLIGLYRHLNRQGKGFRITGAKKEIQDLFQIVNLTELFQVKT